MVYVGQTRSRSLIARCNTLGWGEMTTRSEIPPKRRPWVFDNGAFLDWRRGQPFDHVAYRRALNRVVDEGMAPAWSVVPDIVAGGLASLGQSLAWMEAVRRAGPIYLAVQDGMTPDGVWPVHHFDGIFVGGTLPWKLRTGEAWVAWAHEHGKPCHVGRVGTYRRVLWARRIGADSIDSSLPLWSRENLAAFLGALGDTQLELEATP